VIVAYLDANRNDIGYKQEIDPADMDENHIQLNLGGTTTRNFTLVDP